MGHGGPRKAAAEGHGQERLRLQIGPGEGLGGVVAVLGDVVAEVGRGVPGLDPPAEGVALSAGDLCRGPGTAARVVELGEPAVATGADGAVDRAAGGEALRPLDARRLPLDLAAVADGAVAAELLTADGCVGVAMALGAAGGDEEEAPAIPRPRTNEVILLRMLLS